VLNKNISHDKRAAVLNKFEDNKFNYLICTDVLSRGLDLSKVAYIVQFDFATSAVVYLHRVGRTARAGSSGKVISFVLPTDEKLAKIIEANVNKKLDPAFSHRRSFNKKIKKQLKQESGTEATQSHLQVKNIHLHI